MKPHYERESLIWKSRLSASQKIILLALNQFLGGNDCCWPSQETVARMTALSRKAVNVSIKSLCSLGFVEKESRPNNGSCNYKIRWDLIEKENDRLPDCDTVSYENVSPRVTPPVTQGYTPCYPGLHPPVTVGNTEQIHIDQIQLINAEVKNNFCPLTTKNGIPDLLDRIKSAYNETKPSIWTALMSWNDARRKMVAKCRKDYDDDAIVQMVRDACQFACHDKNFWGSKKLSFDTLFREGRLTELSEKWQDTKPVHQATLSATPSVRYEYQELEDGTRIAVEVKSNG